MAKIVLPSVKKVSPSPDFHLGDGERALFDGFTMEHVRILGTPLDYFPLDRAHSVKDPLYNEPTTRVYAGPYRVWGYMEYPENTPEVTEQGVKNLWECSAWIPRKFLEDAGCAVPNEGDLIRVWMGSDFFGTWASGNEPTDIPGQAYMFDCVNINDDGHLFDNAAFVGYKVQLRRRSYFTPERRIDDTF